MFSWKHTFFLIQQLLDGTLLLENENVHVTFIDLLK